MSNYLDHLAIRVGYASYSAYLQSAYWKAFSASVRAENCYCCQSQSDLNIHHVTYGRLGCEEPEDVVTVCGECHVEIHVLAKSGVLLCEAHVVRRKLLEGKPKRRRKEDRWVPWQELQNKSKRQTLRELSEFLTSQRLWDGFRATDEAHRRGLVRRVDGRERWNLRRYIALAQRAKKRSKRRAQS